MELQFRRMNRTERDLVLFKDAFARNGYPRTLEHLRWQYFANPTRHINVEFALADDESRVAAIYSVMPVAVKIGHRVGLGCQSLDTLTDADFRGKGLFVKMAQTMYSRLESEGYAFVYGFPNGSSAHGFFNRLAWKQFDPVPFLFKPLRLNYALRKTPLLGRFAEKMPALAVTLPSAARFEPQQELREVSAFDEAFDNLWEQFSAGIVIAVHRNAAYLNWRLAAKPDERYRRVALYENGKLCGFVAWTVKEKHGGNVGYLMELIFGPDVPAVGTALLEHANHQMFIAGAEVILAWNFAHSPNHSAFRKNGYWPLPERLRPIELHAGTRALADASDAPVENRDGWYLSYLDSDTV